MLSKHLNKINESIYHLNGKARKELVFWDIVGTIVTFCNFIENNPIESLYDYPKLCNLEDIMNKFEKHLKSLDEYSYISIDYNERQRAKSFNKYINA